MKKFQVCWIFVFSIIFSMSFNSAFSYTEGFEESQPTFTKSPLVCAVEFQDNSVPQIEMIMKKAKNAILEWKGHLQNTERYPKDQYIWNIDYTFVPLTETNKFDFSKCDTVIRFQPKPDFSECTFSASGDSVCIIDPANSNKNCDILGVTKYNVPIEIYIYYRNACVGSIQLSEERIGTTILHEFGHALGLGHYVSDDELINNRWSTAELTAPSIMAIFASSNVKYEQIRPLDVEKVLSLYGENGFLPDPIIKSESVTKSPINEKTTETNVWDIPESKIPEWVKNPMKWFVEGKISEEEMNNAIQFLISEGIIKV